MANSSLAMQVPCSLIYGESDWMNPEAGKKILGAIQEERGKLTASDLQVTSVLNHGRAQPFSVARARGLTDCL
jgi:hypothetical protein